MMSPQSFNSSVHVLRSAMRFISAAVFVLGLTVAAACACGADPLDEEYRRAFGPLHDSEAGLKVTFTPGLWMPRLTGEVQYGSDEPLQLRRDLTMRNSEPTFNAELALRWHERWELHFSGFHFNTDSINHAEMAMTFGEVSLAPGERFRSEFEMTSISAELRVSAFRPLPLPWDENGANNSTSDGLPVADLRFKPTFGARWVRVTHEVEALGGNASIERVHGEWAVPYAGLSLELTGRPEIPFTEFFRIDASASMGPAFGSGTGFAWHVRAGLTWHFTHNLGVTVGYRLVDLNVKKDEYHLRGGLQGLFAAGSIRF